MIRQLTRALQLRRVRLLLFMLCATVLLYGLFRPAPPPDLFQQSDKVLHLLAFAALSFTGRAAFPTLSPVLFWGLFLLLGPALEATQHLLQPTRVFSLEDAIANVAGITLGCAAWWITHRLERRYSPGAQ